MNIAFFGTSAFIGSVQDARLLRRLIDGGIKPVVVITAPDALQAKAPSAIKTVAMEQGIPLLQPSTLKNFADELQKFDLDLSIVAAYGKILPRAVLQIPKFGSLNIHPSLLPRYRGTTPIQSVILGGDSITGVTVIQMDELMDHGPIVKNQELRITNQGITAVELSEALTDLGVDLLLETIQPWVEGRITPIPQDESQATFTKMLKKEDGKINWNDSARKIERMTRAYLPWPGAYTFWQREEKQVRLLLLESRAERVENRESTGTVMKFDKNFAVKTEQGVLIVERLKPEGGNEMSSTDFIRGHPEIINSVLS